MERIGTLGARGRPLGAARGVVLDAGPVWPVRPVWFIAGGRRQRSEPRTATSWARATSPREGVCDAAACISMHKDAHFPPRSASHFGSTLRVESRRKGHPSTCVARVHIAHVSITTIYAYGQGWGAQVAARRAQYRQRGAHAHIETHRPVPFVVQDAPIMRRTGPVCTTRQVPRAIYIAQRARTRSCNVLAV